MSNSPHEDEPARQQTPPPAGTVAGRRWSSRHVVLSLVIVGIVAAVAGFFIGRATKSTKTPEAAAQETWQALPDAPIAGRSFPGAGVVWTGTEMILWGGSVNGTPTANGAAYDPAKHSWHTIASPPPNLGAPGVWTDSEVVAWSGNSPDGPAVGAVYDPQADSWRSLPAGPLGPREGYSAVWDGKELLIIGGSRGDSQATPVAGAVDPKTGAWRVLHGLDKLTYFGGPSGAVWSGHEVFMTGNLSLCPEKGSACGQLRAAFTAYDPATDTVRELKLPPPSASFGSDTASSLKAIAWTGTNVVFTAPAAGSTGSVRIFRYNPTTGVWKTGVDAPCYLPPAYTQNAWIGDRFVAACGSDGLQIYDPATDTWTWRTVTPGPSPLNSRDGSAIVWTGTDLIAWSGSVPKPRNPTPSDGASLTLKG